MIEKINIPVKQPPHGDGLSPPKRVTPGAAGMDLLAALEIPVDVLPGEWRLIPRGLAIQLPGGFEAQPRSGLAFKHGVTVLDAPGTIDEDYRGEVGVLLINHGKTTFTVRRGERMQETARGDGGFGHTGQ